MAALNEILSLLLIISPAAKRNKKRRDYFVAWVRQSERHLSEGFRTNKVIFVLFTTFCATHLRCVIHSLSGPLVCNASGGAHIRLGHNTLPPRRPPPPRYRRQFSVMYRHGNCSFIHSRSTAWVSYGAVQWRERFPKDTLRREIASAVIEGQRFGQWRGTYEYWDDVFRIIIGNGFIGLVFCKQGDVLLCNWLHNVEC